MGGYNKMGSDRGLPDIQVVNSCKPGSRRELMLVVFGILVFVVAVGLAVSLAVIVKQRDGLPSSKPVCRYASMSHSKG